MKVLSIGNSFSQDAHGWLHAIAAHDGADMETVNLYVGGCPLVDHRTNYEQDAAVYEYQVNGQKAEEMTSIKAALTRQEWDVVTLQQASHFSGMYETYQPYLEQLAAAVREHCPRVEVYVHQTWSYEQDTEHSGFAEYGCDQQEMYRRLTECYQQAAQSIRAGLLPVGEVIQTLRDTVPAFDYAHGGMSLNLETDGFHLSRLYGRYAAGLTWYGVLTGRDVRQATFVPHIEGQETDETIIATIRQTVHAVLSKGR